MFEETLKITAALVVQHFLIASACAHDVFQLAAGTENNEGRG